MLNKYFRFALLLVVFMSFTTMTYGGDFKYVGVKKCKTCHKTKKIGDQFGVWSAAKHANALKSLASQKSLDYAKANGIADPTKEAKCLNCHSTMATVDKTLLDLKGKMTIEEGVSCESCHGPGSVYKKKSIMVDHEKSLASGLLVPDEKVCKTCHGIEHKDKNPFAKEFNFAEAVKKVSHPVPGE